MTELSANGAVAQVPRRPTSNNLARQWAESAGLAAAVGIVYLLAARLGIGLVLKPAGVAKANFKTVSGDFSFGKDGEWSKSRMFWTQVQNAQANNLDQFREGTAQPIVRPPEAKTGTLIYPYEKARQN